MATDVAKVTNETQHGDTQIIITSIVEAKRKAGVCLFRLLDV